MKRGFAVVLVLAGPSVCALAHKPSDAYLTLTLTADQSDVLGRIDLALRDLHQALVLDANADGSITRGELRTHEPKIERYVLDRLLIEEDGIACPTHAKTHSDSYTQHSDGTYKVFWFVARCVRPPRILSIKYALFFEEDPSHRGLLRLEDGFSNHAAIFRSDDRTRRFELKAGRTIPARSLATFVGEGVRHIAAGVDHILFLLALLLPSVLRRQGGRWEPADRVGPVFRDVLKVVTAFTLAHSITLAVATLGWVRLPSRWVEFAIAVSIVVAAANNLVPLFREGRWAVAFTLGLLHGFGFSAALVDLGLTPEDMLVPLFGFNAGVELGQLAIAVLFFPVAFFWRSSWFYRRVVLDLGSAVVITVATMWSVARLWR